jgi:hypothetical protein
MKHSKLSRSTAVLALAVAFAPHLASAQTAETLTMSGTFDMDALEQYGGTVGADLAGVYARGNAHGWSLTLYGVTYTHDYSYEEWYDESGYFDYAEAQYITRVHAMSFDLQFFGFDADLLNQVVGSQLTRGDLTGGACLELTNGSYFENDGDGWDSPYGQWTLGLAPPEPAGVSFFAIGWKTQFTVDVNQYPVVAPQSVPSDHTVILDHRPGNDGALRSYSNIVDIGSSEPPVPPPPPSTLSIADGSVLEGKKGTRRLHLKVTLSWSSSDVVTVSYATVDGTALAKSDYTATSGTLTIPAGQTEGAISIAVKGDRNREPNETFSVQLLNAVGATIADGVATATIVNDD